ncbi:MAG: hypothetical protein PF795_11330, partial [Kiritimatiellae bacterium]|nr:hypothetical protein [Kiritimatiellia bacterium]
ALLQVGIILLGILAASVCCKIYRDYLNISPPSITYFVRYWGIILVLIPLIWVGITTHVRINLSGYSFSGTALMFIGLALIVALTFFMVSATFWQFTNFTSSINS